MTTSFAPAPTAPMARQPQHGHHDDPTVPRGILIAVAAMLAFVLALTAAVSAGWLPQSANPAQSRAAQHIGAAQVRSLHFADRADGAVLVTDANSGAIVRVIGFGEGGFLRATMRRLVKSRRAKGIGAAPPFKLVLWENGAMSLDDPATGKSAEVFGFGANQNRIFSEMLQGAAS